MKRVLYSAAPPGGLSGGVICALDHLCAVRADFDKVGLITCEVGFLEARAMEVGIPVHCIPLVFCGLRSAGPLKFFRYIWKVIHSRWRYFVGVFRLLDKGAILHIHSRAAHLPYALMAGRLAGATVVVTIHEPGGTGQEEWFDWCLVRLLAHRVVFLTGAMKMQYSPLPEGRSVIVGNHAMMIPTCETRPHESFRLAMVASMTWFKGLDVFLNICLGLKIRGTEFSADLVGGWPSELDRTTSMEFLRQHGLDGVVKIRGALENMEPLYASIDILVLPTRRDSYPRVVMEAMCRGIPVVATRVDGIPEMVEDGITGFLVESEDVNGFTDATERLLNDLELRKQMGNAARKRARVLFSPEMYRQKMAGVYAGLETER